MQKLAASFGRLFLLSPLLLAPSRKRGGRKKSSHSNERGGREREENASVNLSEARNCLLKVMEYISSSLPLPPFSPLSHPHILLFSPVLQSQKSTLGSCATATHAAQNSFLSSSSQLDGPRMLGLPSSISFVRPLPRCPSPDLGRGEVRCFRRRRSSFVVRPSRNGRPPPKSPSPSRQSFPLARPPLPQRPLLLHLGSSRSITPRTSYEGRRRRRRMLLTTSMKRPMINIDGDPGIFPTALARPPFPYSSSFAPS